MEVTSLRAPALVRIPHIRSDLKRELRDKQKLRRYFLEVRTKESLLGFISLPSYQGIEWKIYMRPSALHDLAIAAPDELFSLSFREFLPASGLVPTITIWKRNEQFRQVSETNSA